MKQKIKLSLLGLSICSAMFLSCEKKAVTPTHETISPSSVTASTTQSGPVRGPRPPRYLDWDGYCKQDMAVNCVKLPEVVVSPNRIATLINVAGDSPTAVAAIFNDPAWADFNAELPDEYVTALQSGNYSMSISGENDDQVCFMVGPNAPVTMSNFEFALQLYK